MSAKYLTPPITRIKIEDLAHQQPSRIKDWMLAIDPDAEFVILEETLDNQVIIHYSDDPDVLVEFYDKYNPVKLTQEAKQKFKDGLRELRAEQAAIRRKRKAIVK